MKTIIKNAKIINRGQIIEGDLMFEGERIIKIAPIINEKGNEIDAKGNHLMPGIVDDQVHFREPGLTHKANIASESRAAVAGGVTSFMEMPNTNPATLTQTLLESKYAIASQSAYCNYSFFMGASNDNLEEVLKTDPKTVCGIKVFMGSSTGNMLVDNETILENLFSSCPMLIATHCEDEATVRANIEKYKAESDHASYHPIIRDVEACYLSSSKAAKLALKHGTRLHILHISTAKEIELFDNKIPLSQKKITAEACVHHLYFNDNQYLTLGNLIKCNPAIKTEQDQKAIFEALMNDKIDIIATDHAPHTWDEKNQPYNNAPSGLPLVQHSLQLMLSFYKKGMISLEKIVEKMCHAPADCFKLSERGYLDEGNFADFVLFDANQTQLVQKSNIYYKCEWSPLENQTIQGQILKTFVNGNLVFEHGKFGKSGFGKRLLFKS